jgi:hypothetical protein
LRSRFGSPPSSNSGFLGGRLPRADINWPTRWRDRLSLKGGPARSATGAAIRVPKAALSGRTVSGYCRDAVQTQALDMADIFLLAPRSSATGVRSRSSLKYVARTDAGDLADRRANRENLGPRVCKRCADATRGHRPGADVELSSSPLGPFVWRRKSRLAARSERRQ